MLPDEEPQHLSGGHHQRLRPSLRGWACNTPRLDLQTPGITMCLGKSPVPETPSSEDLVDQQAGVIPSFREYTVSVM